MKLYKGVDKMEKILIINNSIEKEPVVLKNESYTGTIGYGFRYESRDQSAIFNFNESMCESPDNYIFIENLQNETFLNNHNIEYIIENNQIIPIGIIDFTISDRLLYSCMGIYTSNKDTYYKMPQYIRNIERAFEIKYEAVKFLEMFK